MHLDFATVAMQLPEKRNRAKGIERKASSDEQTAGHLIGTKTECQAKLTFDTLQRSHSYPRCYPSGWIGAVEPSVRELLLSEGHRRKPDEMRDLYVFARCDFVCSKSHEVVGWSFVKLPTQRYLLNIVSSTFSQAKSVGLAAFHLGSASL